MTPEAAIELVEQLLDQKRLTKVQEIVFRQSWQGKTYLEMGRDSKYDTGHLKDVGSQLWRSLSLALNEKVTKHNLHGVLKRIDPHTVSRQNHQNTSIPPETVVDWSEAIDVSYFDGRTAELDQIRDWIGREEHPCRLVALLGMGGIGKTSLAVKLAQQIRNEYQFVVWRSLKDAPPVQELLEDLIKVLSQHQATQFPERTSQKISKLIHYLQSARCLIILDNFETVLADGQRAGTYLPGYEAYGELLQQVGEVSHASCLLLTSREKPAEVAALEGETLPVRSQVLSGLDLIAATTILSTKGLSGHPAHTETLVQRYQGNPLALKIASTSIVDLFEGDIREFLDQGTVVFNGIRNLLADQIGRCSEIETQIMYWLAINREPVSLIDLQADLYPTVSRARLLEALDSLGWRSLIEKTKLPLIEKHKGYFTQQPVVMEYITDQLIEQTTQALLTGQVDRLNQYALIKAEAKDYLRESQIRVILDPISNHLKRYFNSLAKIEQHCQGLIETLRKHYQNISGYATGNLINLLRHFNIDLTGYDFSELAVWQAYLQGANLNRVNFSRANLSCSRFTNAVTNSVWVEFSPDGTHLATSDANGSIRLWNPNNGQEILSLAGHLSWTWAVRFSPKGDLLASCSGDYTIRLWDTRTGLWLRTLLGHTSSVWAVGFSPDGNHLASSSLDQTVKIWDLQRGLCLCTIEQTGGHSIAFSPDGKQLAIVQRDQTTIALWDIENQCIVETLRGHTDTIWSLAFSPDGTLLASGSEDQTARLWWVGSGECHAAIPSHSGCVWTVAFSPTDSILGLGSDSGLITLWDFQQQVVRQTLQGHSGHLWSISFSPDGQRLASSAEDQTIRLWLVKTGQCLRVLQGYNNRIRAMAVNSTGLLACATNDRITLRNLVVEHSITQLRQHTGEVYSVAFTPDGNWLASGCNDGIVKIWQVNTAHCLQSFRAHRGLIFKVLFHPTQPLLISAGSDGTTRIWDISAFRCLYTLTGHAKAISDLLYTPSGEQLLSCGRDQTIKLWHLDTGHVTTLKEHQGWVWSIALLNSEIQQFPPQTLISGSQDETVKLWNLETTDCFETWRPPRPYEGMNISRVTGLTAAQKFTLKLLGATEVE